MRPDKQGFVFPPYRLRPNRALAAKYLQGQGVAEPPAEVPPTYFLFLRGEAHGVDLFRELEISRLKALHGGQRYEWFAPVGWDDELEVTVTVERITEKQGRSGTIWFADLVWEYRHAASGELALRELDRIVERS